jgi:predicted Zn-dependent peptidase
VALRLLPPLLYGEGHPYAIPLTGSGKVASIQSVQRDHLLAWQQAQLRPERMRLVVVGDIELEQLLPQLEVSFGDWKPAERVERPLLAMPARDRIQRLYLIDRPGAPQSLLLAGRLLPATGSSDESAIDAAVNILGGMFSSRLNMNLREDKHWAYGSYAFASNALGPRPLMLYAQVETPRSGESLVEMRKELAQIIDSKPPSAEELGRIVANEVRGLPGSFETAAAVAGALQGMLRYDRPLDWVSNTKQRLESLTVDEVTAAARTYLQPADFTWLVVGDRSQIEAQLRELDFDQIVLLDEEGRVVE